jgi:hypothetical protein
MIPPMDADPVDATTADPADETAGLLRGIAQSQLTPSQSTDLDAVLDELEQFVAAPERNSSVLVGPNGDLKIIEITAGTDGSPVSKTQRERIKRLVAKLTPDGRRPVLRRRR